MAHSAHGFSLDKAKDFMQETYDKTKAYVAEKAGQAANYADRKANRFVDRVENDVQPYMKSQYYMKPAFRKAVEATGRWTAKAELAYDCGLELRRTGTAQACAGAVAKYTASGFGASFVTGYVGSKSFPRAVTTTLENLTTKRIKKIGQLGKRIIIHPTLNRLAASAAPKLIHPVLSVATAWDAGRLAGRVISDQVVNPAMAAHFRRKSQEHQDRLLSETALLRKNCDVATTYSSLLRNEGQAAANAYLNRVRSDPSQHVSRPCRSAEEIDEERAGRERDSEQYGRGIDQATKAVAETTDPGSDTPDNPTPTYRTASPEEIDEERAVSRERDRELYKHGVDQATKAVAETTDRGRELAELEQSAIAKHDRNQRPPAASHPSTHRGPTAWRPGLGGARSDHPDPSESIDSCPEYNALQQDVSTSGDHYSWLWEKWERLASEYLDRGCGAKRQLDQNPDPDWCHSQFVAMNAASEEMAAFNKDTFYPLLDAQTQCIFGGGAELEAYRAARGAGPLADGGGARSDHPAPSGFLATCPTRRPAPAGADPSPGPTPGTCRRP